MRKPVSVASGIRKLKAGGKRQKTIAMKNQRISMAGRAPERRSIDIFPQMTQPTKKILASNKGRFSILAKTVAEERMIGCFGTAQFPVWRSSAMPFALCPAHFRKDRTVGSSRVLRRRPTPQPRARGAVQINIKAGIFASGTDVAASGRIRRCLGHWRT